MNTDPKELGQFYTGHARTTLAQAQFYSRVVRALRFLLPVIALAIVVAVIGWTAKQKAPVPVQQNQLLQSAAQNELLNPRYEGTDNKLRPFTVTARRARQDMGTEETIILDHPVADIELNSSDWVALEAEAGVYNQKTQTLNLSDGVELFHNKGYTLMTEKIDIDLENQRLKADNPTTVQGPAGRIEAQALEGENTKSVLIFKGPVILTIYPDQEKTAEE